MHRAGFFRHAVLAAAAAVGLSLAVATASAAGDAALFRLILKDGTALACYGEYARVGDRVVFSMPLGKAGADRLQLVNLPASVFDWEATERYADAARYAQYVATRAEADYAMLTGDVARALNEIALATDPARRLQIAEDTRRMLAGWPADHFGYRSRDVREMVSLLEETIERLRAAAGSQQFDLSLVAMIEPPTMPLLPDPSPAQAIEQALLAARLADVPAERLALLRSVLAVIDESASELPKEWVRRARETARDTLEAELDVQRRYNRLQESALRRASSAASNADVRSVERAIRRVRRQDASLGRKRNDEIAALLATLEEKLDSARRLRLMRDQWTRRAKLYAEYRDSVTPVLDGLEGLRPELEDIRSLAGPSVSVLPRLITRFDRLYRKAAVVTPPTEMASAHATLLSAADLGQQAARARERATVTGDVRGAWDASAAASGSIMMLAQARQQIEQLSRPPELR